MKEKGETVRDICRGPRETESGKINKGCYQRVSFTGSIENLRGRYGNKKAKRTSEKRVGKV